MDNSLPKANAGSILLAQDELGIPIDVDYLGIQHPQNSKRRADGSSILTDLVRLLPHGSNFGCLDFAFGDSLEPIRALLDSGKIRSFRTHFFNGPGVRNGKAAKYEPTYGLTISTFNEKVLKKDKKLLGWLTKRVALWAAMMKTYQEVIWYVSLCLEHNLEPKAFGILRDVTTKALGGLEDAILVNNASAPTPAHLARGELKEDHGQGPWGPKVTVSSTDGLSIEDTTMSIWKPNTKKHKLKFIWSRFFNGRHSGDWEDPRSRTAWPTQAELIQALHVTDVQPKQPSGKPAILKGIRVKKLLPTGKEIWKVLADDHGEPDPRKNLPVLIVKGGSSPFKLVAINSKIVGRLTYFGEYEQDKTLNRYYAGHVGGTPMTGYEMQEHAREISGSPWVWATDGNVAYGPILPGRRQGKSRP